MSLPDTAKLRWQCRRGLLELDLILGRFLEDCYPSLEDELKLGFARLLEHDDQQLLDWLVQGNTGVAELDPVFARILEYHGMTHYRRNDYSL